MYVLKVGGIWRGLLKPVHKRAGICILFLSFGTWFMGIQEKATQGSDSDTSPFSDNTIDSAKVIVNFGAFTAICVVFTVVKFTDKSDGNNGYNGNSNNNGNNNSGSGSKYEEIRVPGADGLSGASMKRRTKDTGTLGAAPAQGQYNSLYSNERDSFH